MVVVLTRPCFLDDMNSCLDYSIAAQCQLAAIMLLSTHRDLALGGVFPDPSLSTQTWRITKMPFLNAMSPREASVLLEFDTFSMSLVTAASVFRESKGKCGECVHPAARTGTEYR